MNIKITKNFQSIKEFLPIMSVFACPEYLSTLTDEYGWFVSDQFILPFAKLRKILFNQVVLPSETILIDPNAGLTEEKLFLNEVVVSLKKMGAHFILQTPPNAIFRIYPKNSIFIPFGTYRLTLSLPKETLFKNIHSKHRNSIRRAEKEGVVIRHGEQYLKICCDLINKTFIREKFAPLNKAALTHQMAKMGKQVECFVALKNDDPQGCAIIPWNAKRAYYLYGGSSASHVPGALNLLHWQIIEEMKTRNVAEYDFVGARIQPKAGSKIEGIQNFKLRFGGTLCQGYMWKQIINWSTYLTYRGLTFMKSWTLLRNNSLDIIDQEKQYE